MIGITCWAILMLECGSSVACSVAEVAFLCRVASDPKGIVHSFAVMKKVNMSKTSWIPVQRYDGKPLIELGPMLIVLYRDFSDQYFTKHLDYRAQGRDFKLHLRQHVTGIVEGRHNVEFLLYTFCITQALSQNREAAVRS